MVAGLGIIRYSDVIRSVVVFYLHVRIVVVLISKLY